MREKTVLLGNLGRMAAIRRIRESGIGGMSPRDVYKLYMLAYDDEDAASMAAAAAMDASRDR